MAIDTKRLIDQIAEAKEELASRREQQVGDLVETEKAMRALGMGVPRYGWLATGKRTCAQCEARKRKPKRKKGPVAEVIHVGEENLKTIESLLTKTAKTPARIAGDDLDVAVVRVALRELRKASRAVAVGKGRGVKYRLP